MEPALVVVIRHPDFSDDIHLYGVAAKVIYIDLGSSFDSRPNDAEQAIEWAGDTWAEVDDLPADHPAREVVREVIENACDGILEPEQLERLLGAPQNRPGALPTHEPDHVYRRVDRPTERDS